LGFAERYGRGGDHEPIEHRAPFRRALDILRQAGVQLLPVPAQRVDETLQFNLHTHNEIDELVNEHRLDALVSDSRSAAFHAACWHGYPCLASRLGTARCCGSTARDGRKTRWRRWCKVIAVPAVCRMVRMGYLRH
jgi:hypothetical protein